MNVSVIGIDLAKRIFHIIGLNQQGRKILKKKLRRAEMLTYFANLTPCTIAMEACTSSHYWARELNKLGHQVKLLPAQHVKPFVRGNKNDFNDALGIAEASRIPQIREVSVKTVEQQSYQALQRLRRSAVDDRKRLANQVRGLLAEFGIVLNLGVAQLRKAIPRLVDDVDNGLLLVFRQALSLKYQHLCELDDQIDALTASIQEEAKQHPEIRLLQTIPGYGLITSSAFYTAIGDGKGFAKSRDVSASLGIVPRQHSTGGKNTLLGISKKGSKYLRCLLVHGARSVIQHAHKKDDALSRWVASLIERRGKNKATVALANKMARIGWAVITSGKPYEDNYAI